MSEFYGLVLDNVLLYSGAPAFCTLRTCHFSCSHASRVRNAAYLSTFAKSFFLFFSVFSSGAATAAPGEKYPAMSEEEIEEWLSHIPVFAVTDSKGQGVVLRPDNDTSVFYFFMSPQMANATLQTLKGANEDMDLQISAMSLGKIWFKILNAGDDAAVKVCFSDMKRKGTSFHRVRVSMLNSQILLPPTTSAAQSPQCCR